MSSLIIENKGKQTDKTVHIDESTPRSKKIFLGVLILTLLLTEKESAYVRYTSRKCFSPFTIRFVPTTQCAVRLASVHADEIA